MKKLIRMFPSKRALAKDAPVGFWLLWIGAPRTKLHNFQTLHVFQVLERDGKHVPGPVLYENAFIGVQAHLDATRGIVAYLNAVHASEEVARAYIKTRQKQADAEVTRGIDEFLRSVRHAGEDSR